MLSIIKQLTRLLPQRWTKPKPLDTEPITGTITVNAALSFLSDSMMLWDQREVAEEQRQACYACNKTPDQGLVINRRFYCNEDCQQLALAQQQCLNCVFFEKEFRPWVATGCAVHPMSVRPNCPDRKEKND